jgi:hypothetical protein
MINAQSFPAMIQGVWVSKIFFSTRKITLLILYLPASRKQGRLPVSLFLTAGGSGIIAWLLKP